MLYDQILNKKKKTILVGKPQDGKHKKQSSYFSQFKKVGNLLKNNTKNFIKNRI